MNIIFTNLQIDMFRRFLRQTATREAISELLDEADQVNQKLAGCISADQIVPYPPGIPVLVPGQVITPEIISYLVNLLRSQKQVELHGVVFDGWLPGIRVLTESDTASLRPLDEAG